MLDQIASLVKEYGQDTVVNNPNVPDSENNMVLAEATKTITGGLQNMLAGGGLQDIISMFTGGGGNQSGQQTGGIAGLLKNPLVSMMIGHLIGKLTNKFNMSPQQASQISNQLVPNVLNGLISRTTSQAPENDSFDLNDLISSLTGGKTATSGSSTGGFDFQGLLNQFTGGQNTSSSNSNGFDLQDIIQQVTQGAAESRSNKNNSSGGGLADLIKGFFS